MSILKSVVGFVSGQAIVTESSVKLVHIMSGFVVIRVT